MLLHWRPEQGSGSLRDRANASLRDRAIGSLRDRVLKKACRACIRVDMSASRCMFICAHVFACMRLSVLVCVLLASKGSSNGLTGAKRKLYVGSFCRGCLWQRGLDRNPVTARHASRCPIGSKGPRVPHKNWVANLGGKQRTADMGARPC